jgi:hypothetical protein
MAIFHLTAKVISRGKGQSAIAAAAYRSGEHLFDQQAGEQKAYRTRSDRIAFTDIMAPANAPEWVHDRNMLWNKAERAEKRKDAQLAREIEIALPHELTAQQREWLVKDFAREAFVRKGYVVDIAIHAPEHDSDKRNHHAHLMVTRRTIGPDGFAATKDWQFDKKQLDGWREQWEHLANRHLERHGHDARIDRRSLKEQGIDREPTIHLGYAANEMTERGVPSDRMAALTEILARNELRFDLQTISTQLAGLEKQLANGHQQQAAQAQRESTDNGQHRALAAAWASRRRHDAAAQIARVQSAAPTPTPPPKLQKAKLIARPVPAPVPAPEPKPHQMRPAARAAMEQKPTPEPQRQQTANAPEVSAPPPRPEPRPEMVQQAKPAPRPAHEQIPAAGQIPASAQHLQGEHRPDADMLRRMGWQWSEGLGRWEKAEERAARATPSEKPAPLRETQAPAPAPVPTPARASVPTPAPAAAQAKAPTPVPAAREPEKTKAPEPQQWGYSSKGKHVTTGFGVFTPTEQINAAHRAAEQAAAKAREEQQRQKDLAELARAARADEAKLRSPGVSFKGLFEAKAAEAIRDDAQKIRAQVRVERHDQVQAKWQNWAQAQNPDRVTPRQVVGSAAQVGKQAVRSSFRVVDRATGAVSSLGDFVGNLLSLSPAHPPEQPNRIDMRTLTSDPEARRQYNLAQHAEAKRRGIAVEALDNIQRDHAAGRDLSAADVSKLPREQLVQIESGGDAYVREMIESARKRAEEYWKGRERYRD